MRRLFLTFILVYMSYGLIEAQNIAGEELLSLSFEELMNMTITGASKKAEKITDAPSIITTITQDEIQKFGGNNLIDLLSRATSFFNGSSMAWRQSSMAVRGDLADEVNPHILFMINGRPFRESNKAGLNASLLTTFPLSFIKHIEIIRGPGSVLHGTNAYMAVVNIITNNDFEKNLSVNAKYGSFNTKQVDVSAGGSVGKLRINGAVSALKTDGWNFQATLYGNDTTNVSSNLSEEALGLNLNLEYEGFTARGFYGVNDMNNVATRDPNANFPYVAERLWVDLGYADSLFNDKYSFSINATMNDGKDRFTDNVTNLSEEMSHVNSSDYLIELTNFVSVSKEIELTFGGTANFLSGNEAKTIDGDIDSYATDPYDRQWYRGYLQVDYQILGWLSVIAGGQLNKVPNVDANFAPRLAFISSFDSGFGAKLLYGQAFRSPNASENGLYRTTADDEVLFVGQPDIKPEVISTFEPQISYTTAKGSVAINYFYSMQRDLIQRAQIYSNATGDLISQGVEVDAKYSPTKNLYLTGSMAYQTSENDEGIKDIYGLPNTMVKLGVSYSIDEYASLNVFNSYYSEATVQGELADMDKVEAFNWMTAKVNVNLNKFMNMKQTVRLSLESVNVLDQKVYNAVLTKGPNKRVLPNFHGRAFYVSAYFSL